MDDRPANGVLEEHRFPCDQCGADMRYDPLRGEMHCDHCGAVQAVGERDEAGGAIRELDFRAALDERLPQAEMEETRVVTCPNCGAETELNPAIHAAECPFCATPVVTDTGINRHIKPRGLLPFALDEAQARKAMTDWLGRLWFAPNGLQQYARKGRTMAGVYVPYWTFDADTKSSYTGMRGDDYYETRTVIRDGKRQQVQVRKTRWRPAAGRVARFFDDVLVLASKALPRKYTDGLQPWDLGAMVPYSPSYLAGFRAEAYQVGLEDAYDDARDQMDRIIVRDIKFDIGGDHQKVMTVDTAIKDVTFKHILLPIWVAAYKYRGKTYRFVVNGRSGRVQGERPWSAWKIAFAVVIGLIVAGVIGYFAAQGQQSY